MQLIASCHARSFSFMWYFVSGEPRRTLDRDFRAIDNDDSVCLQNHQGPP